MKKHFFISWLGMAALLLVTGCSTTKPLPKAYLEKDHEMAVGFTRMPPKPAMRDSDQGGLIGVVVRSGRASTMRDKLAGIQGETLKELLRQELIKALEKKFVIADDAKDLKLDVQVLNWGWFLPTTVLGIKTGAYQFEIMGDVRVYDLKQKKQEVARLMLHVQKPLGDKPGEDATQEALLQAAQDFAAKVGDFLVQRKTPDGKILREK